MKKIIRLTENDIRKIVSNVVNESANRLICEAIPSKNLQGYFKNHGGVDSTVFQDGLGDITDGQINYAQEYPSIKDANSAMYHLRQNPSNRGLFFVSYAAKDGSGIVVGLDRNKVLTTNTFGGEMTKKTGDRRWNNGWNWKGRNNSYMDDSDTYYYGGGKESAPGDFGIHTNADYQHKMQDLAQQKQAYEQEPYNTALWKAKLSKNPKSATREVEKNKEQLAAQGKQKYQNWRDKEAQNMRDYIKKHWPDKTK